jgi:hypothetical protein
VVELALRLMLDAGGGLDLANMPQVRWLPQCEVWEGGGALRALCVGRAAALRQWQRAG